MTLQIEIEGHTTEDAALALDEIKRLVSEGFRTGFNSNDTGRFSFEITGSPVAYYRLRRNGHLLKTKYSSFDEILHSRESNTKDKAVKFDDSDYELGEA
jgi:hypothetical protein